VLNRSGVAVRSTAVSFAVGYRRFGSPDFKVRWSPARGASTPLDPRPTAAGEGIPEGRGEARPTRGIVGPLLIPVGTALLRQRDAV